MAAANADNVLLGPVAISVIMSVLSLPASILGNEAAIRFGRHRAIATVMVVSTAVALAIGAAVAASPLLLLALVLIYGVTIPADSGALTSGMSASAVPAQRGATMALHSSVGFGLSAVGAWAVGVALDAGRRCRQPHGLVCGLRGARRRQPARSIGVVVVAAATARGVGSPTAASLATRTRCTDGPPSRPLAASRLHWPSR